LNVDFLNYYRDRLLGREEGIHRLMGRILEAGLAEPEFRLTDPSGKPVVGVEIHVFGNGKVRTVALQSNPQLSLPEPGPSDTISNKRFAASRRVVLTLPGERFVYDMREGRAIGRQKRLTVELDPYEPIILSTSSTTVPSIAISGPRRLRLGEIGSFALNLVRPSAAAFHVFRLEVVDPTGRVVPHYSGNVWAPNGRATILLPLALNDKVGRWEIRAKDILSGQSRVSIVDVSEAH
jgi:hypothetical protein